MYSGFFTTLTKHFLNIMAKVSCIGIQHFKCQEGRLALIEVSALKT